MTPSTRSPSSSPGAPPKATIEVRGASEHNLKGIDVSLERRAITVVTGVSGSGKSSLAFDTILAEAQRRFFYTLSHYSRQFLDLSARPRVKGLTGLSPAISLAQNETQPSRRATVGTLTDISELLAVLCARFGEQRCPDHDLPTGAQTPEDIVSRLLAGFDGRTVGICAPVVDSKKGVFKKELLAFGQKGYLRAFVDGHVVPLAPPPVLAKDEKHTIKLIVDYVKVKPDAVGARLLRAVQTALAEGEGFGEFFPADAKGVLDVTAKGGGGRFSTAGGCPVCGFSWPRLDTRHFSANSLGRCPDCYGLGVPPQDLGAAKIGADEEEDEDDGGAEVRACPTCAGVGLDPKLDGIRLGGVKVRALHRLPLADLAAHLTAMLGGTLGKNQAFARVADEVRSALKRIDDVGLGYLTVSRRVRSLSGGEAQRLRLAGILAENLRGVLYILDEPSQGLHPSELATIFGALVRLKEGGNTVIIVDHDEQFMRKADWIVDLGPGGGARGGRLMAKFKPADAKHFVKESLTAKQLSRPAAAASPVGLSGRAMSAEGFGDGWLVVRNPTLHNLSLKAARFPLGALTVVAGVSGAGKSSLVLSTLYANLARTLTGKAPKTPSKWHHCQALEGYEQLLNAELIDRRPVAKSSVSMPASYLDVMGELRDLFAAQPDAQVLGLTARDFSLSVEGGRCPECKGRGELNLKMRFLADARVRCPVCKGARYRANVLAVRYLGLNLGEILELTLDQTMDTFRNHRRIVQRLQPAVDLGLGYLKMGQTSASLSGGEAQRLKLVPYLAKRLVKGHVLILDEPTTGLHFEDVGRLMAVLRKLVQGGVTIVMIEHNPDVVAAADWVLELGPGAATAGGRLLYEGPAAGLKRAAGSVMAPFLS